MENVQHEIDTIIAVYNTLEDDCTYVASIKFDTQLIEGTRYKFRFTDAPRHGE